MRAFSRTMDIPCQQQLLLEDAKARFHLDVFGNGFDNNIASIQQWDVNGNSLASVPTIIVNSGPEDGNDNAYPLTTCSLKIFLTLWTRIDEGSSSAPDTVLNSLLGDIKKKLKEDITRGGNAVDTAITSVEPFDTIEGQGEVGLVITVEVKYRHAQTNPKTVM